MCAMDPDVLVDWSLVEQVVRHAISLLIALSVLSFCYYFIDLIDLLKFVEAFSVCDFFKSFLIIVFIFLFLQCIFSHEVPSCPICLFPPVAGQFLFTHTDLCCGSTARYPLPQQDSHDATCTCMHGESPDFYGIIQTVIYL